MSTKDDILIGIIYEEMGAGDVLGDSGAEYGGAVGNNDFYAPGDTRRPVVLGAQDRKGEICKCKKGKKCKCKKPYNRKPEEATPL